MGSKNLRNNELIEPPNFLSLQYRCQWIALHALSTHPSLVCPLLLVDSKIHGALWALPPLSSQGPQAGKAQTQSGTYETWPPLVLKSKPHSPRGPPCVAEAHLQRAEVPDGSLAAFWSSWAEAGSKSVPGLSECCPLARSPL